MHCLYCLHFAVEKASTWNVSRWPTCCLCHLLPFGKGDSFVHWLQQGTVRSPLTARSLSSALSLSPACPPSSVPLSISPHLNQQRVLSAVPSEHDPNLISTYPHHYDCPGPAPPASVLRCPLNRPPYCLPALDCLCSALAGLEVLFKCESDHRVKTKLFQRPRHTCGTWPTSGVSSLTSPPLLPPALYYHFQAQWSPCCSSKNPGCLPPL